MTKFDKFSLRNIPAVQAGHDDFDSLSRRVRTNDTSALLRALAHLFTQNPAPSLWDTKKFQELMINLLPTVDEQTREDLNSMLSKNPNTPRKVHQALKSDEQLATAQEPALNASDGDAQLKRNRFKRKYSIEKLRSSLPSQIPQTMANVVGLAARRNNRHTLRTLLSTNLHISRAYAQHILSDSDGFALAAALRSLRMPRDVARDVLMAGDGKISANPINNPDWHLDQFDRLDPDACRKRLLDWNTAFNNRLANKEDATHQPLYSRDGLEQEKPTSLQERQDAVMAGRKLA